MFVPFVPRFLVLSLGDSPLGGRRVVGRKDTGDSCSNTHSGAQPLALRGLIRVGGRRVRPLKDLSVTSVLHPHLPRKGRGGAGRRFGARIGS